MKKYCSCAGGYLNKSSSWKIFKFMRNTLLLFFITVFNIYANDSYSQNTKLTLNLSKVTVANVLEEIENKSEFYFLFNSKLIDVEREVSISMEDKKISDILHSLFSGTEVKFLVYDRQIILSPDDVTALTATMQQQLKITGTVTDKNGAPVPGANVVVTGTTQGTVTDVAGKYSIEVPQGSKSLRFSFIGMESQEISIGSLTQINATMAESGIGLGEVLVIGYGSIRKKDLTGSIVSVNTEDLHSLAVPSIGDALQGRASGVQVLSSGIPGSDPTFIIRGISSINNSAPLFVIDGVPVTKGLNTLNPNDIESLQVLKDASSTAIYGSRGANGVIIVTTKRGKTEKNHLNLDYFYSIQQPINIIELLNASEYAAYNNEMLSNASEATNPDWADPSILGEGTDWLDALFNPAPIQNLSLSYSVDTDKSNMYASVNYLTQDGIVAETGYKRFTMQFNSDNRIFKFLKFGNNLTLNHDIRSNGDYSIKNTMGSLPTQTIYNADGEFTNQLSTNPQWYGGIDNPIGMATLNTNATNGYNLLGSIFSELDILRDIHLKTSFGLQLNIFDVRSWKPQHDWSAAPQTLASLYQRYSKSLTWVWDNTINYSKVFNNVHAVSLMAGTSAQENTNAWIAGFRQGYVTEETQVLNAGGSVGINATGSNSDWALFSYFGRVNYSYDDKYLFTATLRRDGSSRFGSANRFGTFPSASAAWRISEEDFFKSLTFVNDLKLRIGYGETGNQEIGSNYPFASSLNIGSTSFNNSIVQMVYPLSMPNYSIHWETVKQTNYGFDASVFNNRVKLSVDGFVKNTSGMLVRGVVIITTGYDNQDEANRPYVNAGKMQNRGIEVNIETENLTGNLKWNTSLNLTYIENKIVSLYDTIPLITGGIDGNINLYAARNMNGHPSNAFFGYVTDGIFQTEADVNNAALQVEGATQAGDIRFKDMNNDGVVDDNDRTFIGNPNPKFILSLNNSFSYKGLDFSIFFQGAFGNKIFNANRLQIEGMDAARNQSKEVLNRWTGEGTSNAMPRAVYGDPAQNTRISDRYIEDGSYLRIKTVCLGYTLPVRYTGKIKASSMRFYATAQNLFTLTKYTGIDPEVGVNGIDNNLYPLTRIISVGVNMSF